MSIADVCVPPQLSPTFVRRGQRILLLPTHCKCYYLQLGIHAVHLTIGDGIDSYYTLRDTCK